MAWGEITAEGIAAAAELIGQPLRRTRMQWIEEATRDAIRHFAWGIGDDEPADIARLAERILGYRVFPDAEDRMNRSLLDERAGLLLVPQFTLAADTKKGMRASFTRAAPPEMGEDYFEQLVGICSERLDVVETGRFGANMQVSLVNDGPVTFWLET